MSTQEILLEEIKHQPEPVLREVWHYLQFITRRREEEQEGARAAWSALGAKNLVRAYGDDEPEYTLADLKPQP